MRTSLHKIDLCVIEEPAQFKRSFAGKYQFVSEIGSGGMGVIYKARQPLLNRYYAIKMLNLSKANHNALARFHQEAQAASTLNHPNVIAVHDFGFTDENDPFMVMDFIDGLSLASLIATTGSIPYREALRIFVQITDGMNHAHVLGVLHRDLKPSNVMLSNPESASAEVKIVDFGIAKVNKAEESSSLTQTGDVFGSPLYMSPEQTSGKKVDARSDIYSLGCLMYEVLTGSPPLQAETMIQTMFMHLHSPPPSLAQKGNGMVFSQGLEYVVHKCLEKEPANRYQTMQDLKKDLVKILAEQSIPEQKFLLPLRCKPAVKLSAYFQIVFVLFVFIAAGYSIIQQLEMHSLVERREEQAMTAENKLTTTLHDFRTESLGSLTVEDFAKNEIKQGKDSIDFQGMYPGDTALQVLEGNPNIVSLGLRNSAITAAGFRHLKFPGLQRLDLQGNGISPSLIDAVENLTELKVLNLSTTSLTDKDLLHICKLKKLTDLNLSRTQISDQGCKILAQMDSLRVLNVSFNPQLSDHGVSQLKTLKALRVLDLSRTGVTDTGIVNVRSLTALTDLVLSSTKISDAACLILAKMHLKKLFLAHTDITSRSIQTLSKMKSLIFLELQNNPQISGSMQEYLEDKLGRNNTVVRIDSKIFQR